MYYGYTEVRSTPAQTKRMKVMIQSDEEADDDAGNRRSKGCVINKVTEQFKT